MQARCIQTHVRQFGHHHRRDLHQKTGTLRVFILLHVRCRAKSGIASGFAQTSDSPSPRLDLSILHRNAPIGGLRDLVTVRHDQQRELALVAQAME
jgi:hypothetical protein